MEYDAHGNDSFDSSALDILAEHNLLAPIISPEYGGRGLSTLVTAMIMEEIAAGCAGVAASVAANIHAICPLLVAGTEEQMRQYLPLMTAPKTSLGAIAIMENGFNLDILLQTEEVNICGSSLKAKSGNQEDMIINGSKDYVMNAAAANFITTMIEYDNDSEPISSRFQLLIIPMDTPGIKLDEPRRKLGLRYCSTSAIHFQELKAEPQFMIGSPGTGMQIFAECLYRTVPFIGAICVGVARAAYQHALEVSKERRISGHPVFQESTVSHSLVNMASKLNAARLSVHHACWRMIKAMIIP